LIKKVPKIFNILISKASSGSKPDKQSFIRGKSRQTSFVRGKS
jgi:hypothetical protein